MRTLAAALSLLTFHLLTAGSAHASGAGKTFDQIVVFGESSTDTGNVSRAQCSNEPPYLPAAGFPLYWAPCSPLDSRKKEPTFGLPGYFDDDFTDGFDARLTNGPLWVEFLADALDVERPRPSAKDGTNYAHAGAKTGPDATFEGKFNLRVNLYPGNPAVLISNDCREGYGAGDVYFYGPGEAVCGSEVPHINTQIEQYLWDRVNFSADQLVLIWGGANDLRDIGLDPRGPGLAIANIVENLVTAVATAAAYGAQDIAVLNQGNAARAPIAQALCEGAPDPGLCLEDIASAVTGFNFLLKAALEELQSAWSLQGLPTQVHYVDVFSAIEVAAELSELFGRPFVNSTEPALIPDPKNPPFASKIPKKAEDYAFWDVIHPTSKLYRITAYRVCKTLDRQIEGFEPQCFRILGNQ